jgi:hypothetical protein
MMAMPPLLDDKSVNGRKVEKVKAALTALVQSNQRLRVYHSGKSVVDATSPVSP